MLGGPGDLLVGVAADKVHNVSRVAVGPSEANLAATRVDISGSDLCWCDGGTGDLDLAGGRRARTGVGWGLLGGNNRRRRRRVVTLLGWGGAGRGAGEGRAGLA